MWWNTFGNFREGATGLNGRRITIAEIAAEAGVSVPTVSRVLNGRTDVAPGTRERVESLLSTHGYVRRASRQRPGGAALIDLVFNDIDSPWAVELLRGVEEATHAAGAGMVVSAVHRRSASTRQWLQNLRARTSDGVIFVLCGPGPANIELQRLGIPVVIVDPAGNANADTPTVGATNYAGGRSATEHLLKLGHRRIGLIAGPKDLLCSRARLDGYRAALDEAGIGQELIVQGDFQHQSGFTGLTKLLDEAERPTAVFAASDTMALGAYEAARQRGLRIPDDLSIAGFDDLPESRWASPPLTTVRQPLVEMGALAARTVLRLSRGEPIEVPRVELVTELIVRDSTAPPR
jgi:LacI family transcriptional regulator